MVCSLALLLIPDGKNSSSTEENKVIGSDQKYLESPDNYEWGKGIGLLMLAVIYALSLRQAGFLIATSFFLSIGGLMLGERKFGFYYRFPALHHSSSGISWIKFYPSSCGLGR